MFGKAVLLLVLAAVAVQSYVPHDVEEQVALLDDKNDSLIHHLRETTEDVIKGAKETLDRVHKELAEKVKELIDIAKTKFSRQYQELLEKIKQMKQKAEELKVDIKECLKGHEEELVTINKEFSKKLETCNQDIINQGKTLVEKEKKNIKKSSDILKKVAAHIKKCGYYSEGMECRARVVIEIIRAIREIPDKVTKIVAQATPTILALVPVAQKCVVTETHDLIASELKIAETVQNCINEKLHPHKEA